MLLITLRILRIPAKPLPVSLYSTGALDLKQLVVYIHALASCQSIGTMFAKRNGMDPSSTMDSEDGPRTPSMEGAPMVHPLLLMFTPIDL